MESLDGGMLASMEKKLETVILMYRPEQTAMTRMITKMLPTTSKFGLSFLGLNSPYKVSFAGMIINELCANGNQIKNEGKVSPK